MRHDRREKGGGGCATFIKHSVSYQVLGNEQEYVVIKVWVGNKELVIVYYYNPCQRLEIRKLDEIEGQDCRNMVWCGDFNGHNTLWGSQEKLLMLYNRVWEDGRLPKSWKEAVIIPIRKPGQYTSRPGNYRPIALTSHICKLMERMINVFFGE